MSRVVINEAGISRMCSAQGAVGKLIDHKARLIERAARMNIQINLHRDRPDRTGDLEGSLRMVPFVGREDGHHHVAVGADAQHRGFKYARALETGKDPDSGKPMNFREGPGTHAYMVPAVLTAGFRLRKQA